MSFLEPEKCSGFDINRMFVTIMENAITNFLSKPSQHFFYLFLIHIIQGWNLGFWRRKLCFMIESVCQCTLLVAAELYRRPCLSVCPNFFNDALQLLVFIMSMGGHIMFYQIFFLIFLHFVVDRLTVCHWYNTFYTIMPQISLQWDRLTCFYVISLFQYFTSF